MTNIRATKFRKNAYPILALNAEKLYHVATQLGSMLREGVSPGGQCTGSALGTKTTITPLSQLVLLLLTGKKAWLAGLD